MKKKSQRKKTDLRRTAAAEQRTPIKINKQDKTKFKIKFERDECGQICRPYEVTIDDDKGDLFEIFGTSDGNATAALVKQLISPAVLSGNTTEQEVNAKIEMVRDIQPRDSIEAALAVQMINVHGVTIEMMKRAMLEEQSVDGVSNNVNRVTKMSRLFIAQMEALQRYRSKGQQTIQVQHVNVENGGQAVVGNVNTGGESEK